MKIELSFGTYEGTVVKRFYDNGRTALEIIDSKTFERIMVASVNLPNIKLEKDEILIKNWSENEGVLESLIDANVIKDTEVLIPTGFCVANLCILLPEESWRK